MKKAYNFLIIFLIGCIVGCNNDIKISDSNKPLQTKSIISLESPAPLNTIPQWVKEKVSSDIYEKLKTISTSFLIDYSFLHKDISEKRWEEISQSMDELCKMVEEGKVSAEHPWIWTVASEKPKTSFFKLERLRSDEYDQNEEPRTHTLKVYTASKCSDVYVQVSVNYTYNTATHVASKVSASASAHSELSSRNPNFSGSCQADYSSSVQCILGSCGGILSYNSSPNYRENETLQNIQFRVSF